jgi:hypothetical protein
MLLELGALVLRCATKLVTSRFMLEQSNTYNNICRKFETTCWDLSQAAKIWAKKDDISNFLVT